MTTLTLIDFDLSPAIVVGADEHRQLTILALAGATHTADDADWLLHELERASVVPDTAVQADQTRKLLLVVGKDGAVVPKEVELGPLVDGLRVIRSGLAPTDRVIIEGTQMAIPGSKVKPRPGRIAPPRAQIPAAVAVATPPGEGTFAN